MKNMADVSWTPSLELKVGDRVIPGSNAVDLLTAAVKPVKRGSRPPEPPVGWNEFARALKEHNTPRELVGTNMHKAWGTHASPVSLGDWGSQSPDDIGVEASPSPTKKSRSSPPTTTRWTHL